jgi:hypothetical protein
MIDMGTCWFDDKMVPTVTYDENGNMTSYIYCPYIPKAIFEKPFDSIQFLFDGPAQASTGLRRE